MPTNECDECDVFLSYNSEDFEQIEQIAKDLKDLGLDVWFDKWKILPGEHWNKRLYQGISESRIIITFVGPSGIGPWQSMEVEGALQKHVTQKKILIPVLLPGAKTRPELPPFFEQLHWIKYDNLETIPIKLTQLILRIKKRALDQSISQTGKEFEMKLKAPFKNERDIEIFTLPNPRKLKNLLNLTWNTFGKGIEKLVDQIEHYGSHLSIGACFGINDAGLVIAIFLNGSILERTKIGYIRFEGPRRNRSVSEKYSIFPELDEKPNIMLVDFELKSGDNLKIAINNIRKRYPEASIYYAVFGAQTETNGLEIKCFEELKAAKNINELNIEDLFIACTMHHPGIEPPLLGLR